MEPQVRADHLRDAVQKYRQSVSPFYDEVVGEVSERGARSGSIGKADIGALVAWKRLNASTPWMHDLMRTPEESVRAATTQASQAANDTELSIQAAAAAARSALSPIPGFRIGDALASAVIYALAPNRMAVYDRRAQKGLELVGLALTPRPGRYGRYMTLVEQLTDETRHTGSALSSREIDLALFTLGGPTP
jgi:hypothetical protein